MGFVKDMEEVMEARAVSASNLFETVAALFLDQKFPYRYSRNDIAEWGRVEGIITDDEHDFIQKHFPGSMFEFYPVEDMNQ
jgi:hypothetical protein